MSSFTPLKICAWTTRHPPQPEQAKSLKAAGYKIITFPVRARSAETIWHIIRSTLGYEPDLIVAAMPKMTLHHLARIAPCPVIIAKMDHSYVRPRWTGEWRQVIRIELHTQPFQPTN